MEIDGELERFMRHLLISFFELLLYRMRNDRVLFNVTGGFSHNDLGSFLLCF